MHVNAVIFDLDGTLLDSLEDIAQAMNSSLAQLGLPTHALEAYKAFVGDGVEMLARRALPGTHRDESTLARAVATMRADYARCWDATTRPYEGVPELLDALVARGVRMAVLSNKPDDLTRIIVARLLPQWDFDAVRGARSATDRKPDPAMALEMARELRTRPEECLFLGDTGTDMLTAVAAGMFPVGAMWGFRSPEELKASGARTLIGRPGELLGLL